MAERVELSPGDKERMNRLREEVVARLYEMSLIIARELDQGEQDIVELAFYHALVPDEQLAALQRRMEFKGTEVIHFSSCAFGCYDHDIGACYPC